MSELVMRELENTFESLAQTNRLATARYRFTAPKLVDELLQLVTSEKSVAILGPRGVGKQYLIRQLIPMLRTRDRIPVHLRCDDIEPVGAEATICSLLADGFQRPLCDYLEACFSQLETDFLQSPRRVTLIISDADLLPTSITRRLLMCIRRLTQKHPEQLGNCSVILTGALELSPLLHGAESEFTPDISFVAQAYEHQEFCSLIRKTFSSGYQLFDDAIGQIAELTGHNVAMFNQFCVVLNDLRRRDSSLQLQLTQAVVESVRSELDKAAFGHSHVQVTAFARIENSKTALEQLEKLLNEENCPVPVASDVRAGLSNAPTELELSGIATRHEGQLRWQSRIMGQLARRYFTWWNVGDCYACCDEWQEALRCYEKAAVTGYPWMQDPIRRPRLNAALRAFETHLHKLAGLQENPVSQLLEFFIGAAPYVLGFDDLQKFEQSADGSRWLDRSGRERDEFLSYLPAIATAEKQNGLIELPNSAPRHEKPFCRLIRLFCESAGRSLLLLVSCLKSRSPITHSREEQIRPVIYALTEGFERACRHEQSQSQSRRQEQLLAALPRVFQLVSPREANATMSALKEAGDNLRKLGYRRVMFALVDQHRQEIHGVLDCREAGEPDVAEKTHFKLAWSVCDVEDVQQQCVLTKAPIVLEDARTHQYSCEPRIGAGIKAAFIVPLIPRASDDVLGTMHVERFDKLPLSISEQQSISYFAAQLAIAIEATTSFDLLEGNVRSQADGIVLLDAKGEIAFINSAASTLLRQPCGWRDTDSVRFGPPAQIFPQPIHEVIRTADRLEQRSSGYYRFGGGLTDLHVISAQPLKDRRGTRVGILIQITDIISLSQLWRDLRDIGEATDVETLNAIVLRVFRQRGHEWVRIYRLDPSQTLLRGIAQFGFDEHTDVGHAGIRAFEAGTAMLSDRISSPTSWLCLTENKPKLFEAVAETFAQIGEKSSDRILPLTYVADKSDEPEYLKRRIGDRWIDLPLTRSVEIPDSTEGQYASPVTSQLIGKISVSCPPDFTLEKFEQLRILTEALGSIYPAMNERIRRQRLDEEKKREAMEKAIGETCHRLQSGIAAMEVLVQLVEDAGDAEFKRQWRNARQRLQRILGDATNRLRALRIDRKRWDLFCLLDECLATALPRDQFVLRHHTSDSATTATDLPHSLHVDIDKEMLREAIEELIVNSKKATRKQSTPLKIEIVVQIIPVAFGLGEECRIIYRDNGCGIPADRAGKIFEEWYSHWDHQGTITCEPGDSGACFVLQFPRWADPQSEPVRIDGIEENLK
jgi:type II secretory pathway predicted ATPase ExeA